MDDVLDIHVMVDSDVIVTIDEYVLVELLIDGEEGELYRALWYFQDSLEPYEWEL
jgi:hypothetical protein